MEDYGRPNHPRQNAHHWKMKSQPRCGCNDRWMPYVPLEALHLWVDIQGITDQKLRYQSVHTPKIECPICDYNMWYCAYQEDMFRDLKEMNA